MAISYIVYPIAQVSNITAAIKAAIEATGMYDSVTVSDNVVTAKNDSTTYLTVTVGSTTTFTSYSDNITGAAFTLSPESTASIGIGTAGSRAIISVFGGDTVSLVLAKSKGDQPMIIARWANNTFHCIAKDSAADSTAVITQGANSYYTSLTSVCAVSNSEGVAVPDGAYAIAVRCTVIPAVTDGNKGLRVVTIRDIKHLTDGAFCLAES